MMTTFMYTSSVTPTGVMSTTRPALMVAHNSTQTVIASSQTLVSTSLSNVTVPPHVRTTKRMVTIPPKESEFIYHAPNKRNHNTSTFIRNRSL